MLKTTEPQITNALKWLLIEKVLFRAEIKRQNYLKNGIFELHFRVFFLYIFYTICVLVKYLRMIQIVG